MQMKFERKSIMQLNDYSQTIPECEILTTKLRIYDIRRMPHQSLPEQLNTKNIEQCTDNSK